MSEKKTQSSHYVSRVATKAWEGPDRRLHYFDLKTESMGAAPSIRLFTQEEPLADATEHTLNQRIEDSLGKYVQRCAKQGGGLVDVEGDDRMTRALVALIALQGVRTRQALEPAAMAFSLDQMLANERVIDQLVDDHQREYVLVGAVLKPEEWLCHPSVGSFAIPVLDQQPAAAVPLSPGTFVALVAKGANLTHFDQLVRTTHTMGAFSMLGGGLEHKVVVPASIVLSEKWKDDAPGLAAWMKETRVTGRQLFNLIGKTALDMGLKAYHYDGR